MMIGAALLIRGTVLRMFEAFLLMLWAVGRLFFKLQAGGEGLADGVAEGDVVMAEGVVGDGVEFAEVDLAVRGKNLVVDGDVDDLADEAAGSRIVALYTAFEREGQLGENGRVNALAFLGVPAGTLDFVGDVVARHDADVVGCNEVVNVGNADGERALRKQVGGRLVVVADTDGDLVLLADAAPGGVHGVWDSLLVVSADDQHGHGVKRCFCTNVLSHFVSPSRHLWRLLFSLIIISQNPRFAQYIFIIFVKILDTGWYLWQN